MNAPDPAGDRPPPSSPADMGDEAGDDDAALAEAKARDAAFLLPIAGLAAFSPPMILLFTGDGRVFGAPAIIAYVFVVWAALIVAAAVLSRRLTSERGRGSRR